MKPSEVIEMTVWEFNAYCEGYHRKQVDDLVLQIQAAYYEAYWNGFSKHKRSLESVIKKLYKTIEPKKSVQNKPINIKELEKEFNGMEDLRKHGWTKN